MDTINFLYRHLMFFSLFLETDGYYYYRVTSCVFSSEYIDTHYFNKVPIIQFNSTVGKFVGFNEFGVHNAKIWNSNPDILKKEKTEGDRYCKKNTAEDGTNNILTKSVQPKVKLISEQKTNGPHDAIMICSAYNFYPKPIKMYWLIDGKRVTTDVTPTEEMADGEKVYSVHTHLKYTPKSGEKISCVVEHTSFKKPKIIDLDETYNPSVPESERNKIAIGASGLVLGIILSAAGFIYYKIKSSGRILVPG